MAPAWKNTKLEEAKQTFLTIAAPLTRCETTIAFPEVSNLPVEYCVKAFPGSIAIHREGIRGLELAQGKTLKLFEDELFIPGEPPPQPKEETEGPFVTSLPDQKGTPVVPTAQTPAQP